MAAGGKLEQSGPIDLVIVDEIHLAAVRLDQLLGRDELIEVLVMLNLFARIGVDEGVDYLQEGPDKPGNCWDEKTVVRTFSVGFSFNLFREEVGRGGGKAKCMRMTVMIEEGDERENRGNPHC